MVSFNLHVLTIDTLFVQVRKQRVKDDDAMIVMLLNDQQKNSSHLIHSCIL